MLIGYARTSTVEQKAGLDAQIRDLKKAGAKKIYAEKISSVARRDKLETALDFIREGDTLIVTRLDRLARSVKDLLDIVDQVQSKGARLKILDMNLDTQTSTGKLMLTVLGGIAEFERQIMLERQREGIAKAKAAGKYKGRKPTARAKTKDVEEMLSQGAGPSYISRKLGISRSSVYRIIQEGRR